MEASEPSVVLPFVAKGKKLFSDAKSELYNLVTTLEGNASISSAGTLTGGPGVGRVDRGGEGGQQGT